MATFSTKSHHTKFQYLISNVAMPLQFHTSNPESQMDESHRHTRPPNPTFAGLLFSCCFCCGSNDERSIFRPSCLQKVTRSNPRPDSVVGDSQNWWRKGWNSVRRASEWSESVIDDAGNCCSGPKWKHFVRGFKTDGKSICSSKHSRFNYDPLSYELNFDDGSRQDQEYQLQGLSLSAIKVGECIGRP